MASCSWGGARVGPHGWGTVGKSCVAVDAWLLPGMWSCGPTIAPSPAVRNCADCGSVLREVRVDDENRFDVAARDVLFQLLMRGDQWIGVHSLQECVQFAPPAPPRPASPPFAAVERIAPHREDPAGMVIGPRLCPVGVVRAVLLLLWIILPLLCGCAPHTTGRSRPSVRGLHLEPAR